MYRVLNRLMLTGSIALILAVILVMSMAVVTTTAKAQQGQPQVEVNGGLIATLNGENFRRGETITVSGSIEVRGPYSEVSIHVIDPEGKTVELVYVRVTAANEFTQFTHSFVAGENEGKSDYEEPMVTSGDYRMVIQFGPEMVEFIFGYNTTSGATTGVTTPEATMSDNSTSSADAKNVRAINQSIAQTIMHTEQAYIAMENNDTRGVFRNLNLALNELEGVQGNLTLTAPESSGGTNIDSNTSAEATTPSTPAPPQLQQQRPSPLPLSPRPQSEQQR